MSIPDLKGFRNSETHLHHLGASVIGGNNGSFLCLRCAFDTLRDTADLLIRKKSAIREIIKVERSENSRAIEILRKELPSLGVIPIYLEGTRDTDLEYAELCEYAALLLSNQSLSILEELLTYIGVQLYTHSFQKSHISLRLLGRVLENEKACHILLNKQSGLLQFLVEGLMLPCEETKGMLVYDLLQLVLYDRAALSAVFESDEVLHNLISDLAKTESEALQINILALLRVASESPSLQSKFSCKDAGRALKSLILSPSTTIQLCTCEIALNACCDTGFMDVMIQEGCLDFFFEAAAHSSSDRQLTAILSLLLKLSSHSQFLTAVDDLFTIMDILRKLSSSKFEGSRSEVLMLLLVVAQHPNSREFVCEMLRLVSPLISCSKPEISVLSIHCFRAILHEHHQALLTGGLDLNSLFEPAFKLMSMIICNSIDQTKQEIVAVVSAIVACFLEEYQLSLLCPQIMAMCQEVLAPNIQVLVRDCSELENLLMLFICAIRDSKEFAISLARLGFVQWVYLQQPALKSTDKSVVSEFIIEALKSLEIIDHYPAPGFLDELPKVESVLQLLEARPEEPISVYVEFGISILYLFVVFQDDWEKLFPLEHTLFSLETFLLSWDISPLSQSTIKQLGHLIAVLGESNCTLSPGAKRAFAKGLRSVRLLSLPSSTFMQWLWRQPEMIEERRRLTLPLLSLPFEDTFWSQLFNNSRYHTTQVFVDLLLEVDDAPIVIEFLRNALRSSKENVISFTNTRLLDRLIQMATTENKSASMLGRTCQLVTEILQHEPIGEAVSLLALEAVKQLLDNPASQESTHLLNFLNVFYFSLRTTDNLEVQAAIRQTLMKFPAQSSRKAIEGWMFLGLQVASREKYCFTPIETHHSSPLLQVLILGILSCRFCHHDLENHESDVLPRMLFLIFNTLMKGEEAQSTFAASIFGGIYCRRPNLIEESLWIPFLEELLSEKFNQSHLSLDLGELAFYFVISLQASDQSRLLKIVEIFQTRKTPPQLFRILQKCVEASGLPRMDLIRQFLQRQVTQVELSPSWLDCDGVLIEWSVLLRSALPQ